MSRPIGGPRFAVCVETGEYAASLERWKIYRIVPDADAEAQSQVRVVDESGEDYLFPGSWFRAIELSEDLEALYNSAGGRRGDVTP